MSQFNPQTRENMKTTLEQVKSGASLPQSIYNSKPYILLSKETVVLAAGDLGYIKSLSVYFDEFEVEVRRYDLHANDNSRILSPEFEKDFSGCCS